MIDRLASDCETVRTVRGRAPSLDADRAVVEELSDAVATTGVPAVRVWTPHRQVAFGRRDARAEGYERARQRADANGYPAIERSVGGRAVAYTGTTVAFAAVVPTATPRQETTARYEAATTGVVRALRSLGVPARRGEPDASFCPGEHSVQARGKIAGLAQRIQRETARVSGIVVVDGHEELATVLDEVYDALGVPFAPESVGSVARGGGPADSEAVVDALFDAFCGDLSTESVSVEDVLADDPTR
ncbi:lipoate--protein ligase family protein [Halobellus rufus]|uniref:lipoate--protein ligase family protein n=1 Tax=Halobellus rufus TaxID=1448860 RepID=UPI001E53CB6E|nr:lipoate--protein ligase family protein [Halobellus rufus]